MDMQLLEAMPHPLVGATLVGVMVWLGIANVRESWQVLTQYLMSEELPCQ